jgi:hypothetical protein
MISPRRSRSGSNCWASLSGISMVICIDPRLTRAATPVKPHEELRRLMTPSPHPDPCSKAS